MFDSDATPPDRPRAKARFYVVMLTVGFVLVVQYHLARSYTTITPHITTTTSAIIQTPPPVTSSSIQNQHQFPIITSTRDLRDGNDDSHPILRPSASHQITISTPTISSELDNVIGEIDVKRLEEELLELQNLQTEEDGNGGENDNGNDDDDMIINSSPVDNTDPLLPPPPPPAAVAQQPQSSSSSQFPAPIQTITTTVHSSSSHRLHKHCRNRASLFKDVTTLPALVSFPILTPKTHSSSHSSTHSLSSGVNSQSSGGSSGKDNKNVDFVWREAFKKLSFQETENPQLATFLVSKQSYEHRLPHGELCHDSQNFNHIKGVRAITDPVFFARLVHHEPQSASSHAPDTLGFWGGVSASRRKEQCVALMNRIATLTTATTTSTTAFVAWADKANADVSTGHKTYSRIQVAGLRKMLDSYKRSQICPHADDVVVIQQVKDALILSDSSVCSLRFFFLVAKAKPMLAYVNARFFVATCAHKDDADGVLSFGFSTTTTSSSSSTEDSSKTQTYDPLQFNDLLTQHGRVSSPLWLSDSLLRGVKRSIGESLRLARHKFDSAPGHYSLLAADFCLDSSLKPYLMKITASPDLTDTSARWHQKSLDLVMELLRLQQAILRRDWQRERNAITRPLYRPEDFAMVMSNFELVAFDDETAVSTTDPAYVATYGSTLHHKGTTTTTTKPSEAEFDNGSTLSSITPELLQVGGDEGLKIFPF